MSKWRQGSGGASYGPAKRGFGANGNALPHTAEALDAQREAEAEAMVAALPPFMRAALGKAG